MKNGHKKEKDQRAQEKLAGGFVGKPHWPWKGTLGPIGKKAITGGVEGGRGCRSRVGEVSRGSERYSTNETKSEEPKKMINQRLRRKRGNRKEGVE